MNFAKNWKSNRSDLSGLRKEADLGEEKDPSCVFLVAPPGVKGNSQKDHFPLIEGDVVF